MPTAPLRPKEKDLFTALSKYIEKYGYAPTYRELQEVLGYDAIGSVQTLVRQLIDKGYLVNTGKWRGLALAPQRRASADSPAGKKRGSAAPDTDDLVLHIPLAGYVAAGAPIEAIESQEHIAIARAMTKPGQSYFALKVKGDSMVDDHIVDGDVVVIRKQKTASENEIVVALIDNEATLKRFRKNKNIIELHPANKNYRPIKVDASKNFEILGVLTGVIRTF